MKTQQHTTHQNDNTAQQHHLEFISLSLPLISRTQAFAGTEKGHLMHKRRAARAVEGGGLGLVRRADEVNQVQLQVLLALLEELLIGPDLLRREVEPLHNVRDLFLQEVVQLIKLAVAPEDLPALAADADVDLIDHVARLTARVSAVVRLGNADLPHGVERRVLRGCARCCCARCRLGGRGLGLVGAAQLCLPGVQQSLRVPPCFLQELHGVQLLLVDLLLRFLLQRAHSFLRQLALQRQVAALLLDTLVVFLLPTRQLVCKPLLLRRELLILLLHEEGHLRQTLVQLLLLLLGLRTQLLLALPALSLGCLQRGDLGFDTLTLSLKVGIVGLLLFNGSAGICACSTGSVRRHFLA
eukprot:m.172798 g.172798  ORF g.172798 m.172798 type:complete len:355 (+) comp17302_c1_seq1:153-1217(+)